MQPRTIFTPMAAMLANLADGQRTTTALVQTPNEVDEAFMKQLGRARRAYRQHRGFTKGASGGRYKGSARAKRATRRGGNHAAA